MSFAHVQAMCKVMISSPIEPLSKGVRIEPEAIREY